MKRIRLLAFFHDPIHKAMVLASKRRHEEVAKELANAFGVALTDEDLKALKGMDILASSMERLVLPKGADRDQKYQVMDFSDIVFRHPMSGELVNLNLSKELYEKAHKALLETLETLRNESENKDELGKLSHLWHHLLSRLQERESEIPWQLLPADTRVPDHTIWDHLKLTTAAQIQWHEGRPYATSTLFIFTIGPVQSFIRQARKAQDFWAGSFMLSYLTFSAIQKVVEQYGPTVVIYPDLQAHPWILQTNSDEITRPTIPNRFVALIPETDTKTIHNLARSCEEAVREQLQNWSNIVLDRLNLRDNAEVEKPVVRQLRNAFSVYWIGLVLPQPSDGKEDYENALELIKKTLSQHKTERAEKIAKLAKGEGTLYEPNVGNFFGFLYAYAEKALAARKTLRENLFGEPEPGSNREAVSSDTRVERCHLCGERNAIVRKIETNQGLKVIQYFGENHSAWIDVSIQPFVGSRELPKGEALCAVCLIKRFLPKIAPGFVKNFPGNFSYPSVSDVAVADLMEKWAENPEVLKDFDTSISNIHADTDVAPKVRPIPRVAKILSGKGYKPELTEGEWFFEASLQKKVAERTLETTLKEEDVREAREVLKKLLDAVGRKPCPYYAFIAIDGDQMGKWLAGDKGFELSEKTNIYHPKVWRNLPEEFRKSVEAIFKVDDRGVRPVTPAFHASIAKALQIFALKIVPKIVEDQYLGQIIYAGGDDILAFVNLRDLWKVLRLLRMAYSGLIKVTDGQIVAEKSNQTGVVKTPNGYWLTMGPTASLSAGVVIAHYKTPLSLVIREGFRMEKMAKNELGRDAFAITWLKHSGEITVSGGKWMVDTSPDLIETFEEVVQFFVKPSDDSRKFVLSRRFLKTLDQVYQRIGNNFTLLEPLISQAIRRHIRFTEDKMSDDEKRKVLTEVQDRLMWLLKALNGDLRRFINLFEVGLLYFRYAKPGEE